MKMNKVENLKFEETIIFKADSISCYLKEYGYTYYKLSNISFLGPFNVSFLDSSFANKE